MKRLLLIVAVLMLVVSVAVAQDAPAKYYVLLAVQAQVPNADEVPFERAWQKAIADCKTIGIPMKEAAWHKWSDFEKTQSARDRETNRKRGIFGATKGAAWSDAPVTAEQAGAIFNKANAILEIDALKPEAVHARLTLSLYRNVQERDRLFAKSRY